MKKFVLMLSLFSTVTFAKDYDTDQPTNPDPEFWKATSVQSCCGVGDAYWADEWEVLPDGNWRVWITDPRAIEGRKDMDGKAVTVQPYQLRYPPDSPVNRSGHGIVFLSQISNSPWFKDEPYTYCYFPGNAG